jgi:hypothetical protein
MLKKISQFTIGFLLIMVSSVIHAEGNYEPANKNSKIIIIPFNREMVANVLKDYDNKILKGDSRGNKISYGFYNLFAIQVRSWFKNPWMELESMTAKSWYINLYNTFVRMAKLKRNLEQLEQQHKAKTAVYNFERKKFLAQYKKFKELQAKPTKLSPTRYRDLKRAKAKWEKAQAIKAAKARAAARAKKRRG